jgi:hypothetical protein
VPKDSILQKRTDKKQQSKATNKYYCGVITNSQLASSAILNQVWRPLCFFKGVQIADQYSILQGPPYLEHVYKSDCTAGLFSAHHYHLLPLYQQGLCFNCRRVEVLKESRNEHSHVTLIGYPVFCSLLVLKLEFFFVVTTSLL